MRRSGSGRSDGARLAGARLIPVRPHNRAAVARSPMQNTGCRQAAQSMCRTERQSWSPLAENRWISSAPPSFLRRRESNNPSQADTFAYPNSLSGAVISKCAQICCASLASRKRTCATRCDCTASGCGYCSSRVGKVWREGAGGGTFMQRPAISNRAAADHPRHLTRFYSTAPAT